MLKQNYYQLLCSLIGNNISNDHKKVPSTFLRGIKSVFKSSHNYAKYTLFPYIAIYRQVLAKARSQVGKYFWMKTVWGTIITY